MIFETPVLLAVGAAVLLLVVVGLRRHAERRRRLGAALGGRRAAARLSRGDLYRARVERIVLLGLAAGALGIAAAEPRWRGTEREPPPAPPAGSVVLAIDVSMSMQANDGTPTRLARAVEVARELLETMERDRVGLLLFAGNAYAIAPPTHDHAVLEYFLDGVTPTIASAYDPGTLVSVALRESAALLERGEDGERGQNGGGGRTIVLIGDGGAGEPRSAVLEAAREVSSAGIALHAIGVGTEAGAGMVIPEAPFQLERRVVDANGVTAISRLDASLLLDLVGSGGGRYAHADEGGGVRDVQRALETPPPASVPEDAPPPWARYDLTFWFAAGALLLLLLEGLLDVRLPGLRGAPDRRTA